VEQTVMLGIIEARSNSSLHASRAVEKFGMKATSKGNKAQGG
jgi:hypothetical protein